MGQADVLKLLKKHPKKGFTTAEVNKILNYGNSADNLRRLHKAKEVKRVEKVINNYKMKQYVYYSK